MISPMPAKSISPPLCAVIGYAARVGTIHAAIRVFASFDPIQPDKRVTTMGAWSEVASTDCVRLISCLVTVVEFVIAVILSRLESFNWLAHSVRQALPTS